MSLNIKSLVDLLMFPVDLSWKDWCVHWLWSWSLLTIVGSMLISLSNTWRHLIFEDTETPYIYILHKGVQFIVTPNKKRSHWEAKSGSTALLTRYANDKAFSKCLYLFLTPYKQSKQGKARPGVSVLSLQLDSIRSIQSLLLNHTPVTRVKGVKLTADANANLKHQHLSI